MIASVATDSACDVDAFQPVQRSGHARPPTLVTGRLAGYAQLSMCPA